MKSPHRPHISACAPSGPSANRPACRGGGAGEDEAGAAWAGPAASWRCKPCRSTRWRCASCRRQAAAAASPAAASASLSPRSPYFSLSIKHLILTSYSSDGCLVTTTRAMPAGRDVKTANSLAWSVQRCQGVSRSQPDYLINRFQYRNRLLGANVILLSALNH